MVAFVELLSYFGLLIIAFLALFANCKVDNVSLAADTDGDTQIINLSLPLPVKQELKILVSFDYLNGIWVRVLSPKADMQCPRLDNEPLIDVNYWTCIYLYAVLRLYGILYFYDPAKSTILS